MDGARTISCAMAGRHAPAANLAALAVRVLVALEAFEHVVALEMRRFTGQGGSVVRAHAAAADEHQQGLTIDLLLQLGQEMRVGSVVRVAQPLDLDGTRNAPDPIPFGARAHVNQSGTRRHLPDLVGLLRRQCARVGQSKFAGAVLGELEQIGEFSHGGW